MTLGMSLISFPSLFLALLGVLANKQRTKVSRDDGTSDMGVSLLEADEMTIPAAYDV
jgi:hypothetical protein